MLTYVLVQYIHARVGVNMVYAAAKQQHTVFAIRDTAYVNDVCWK